MSSQSAPARRRPFPGKDPFEKDAENAFMVRHGYHPSIAAREYSTWCAHFLKKRQCFRPNDNCLIPKPLRDHIRVYRTRTGIPVLTSQPYIAPEDYLSITQSAVEFARKWNLYFRISNEESWWAPGETILIEFWGAVPGDALAPEDFGEVKP